MLNKVLGALMLKVVNAANAEQARRAREYALDRSIIGARTQADLSRISWKPQARFVLGDDSMFAGVCVFEREGSQLEIGKRSYFSGLISCAERVMIGDDVLVSQGGYIADHNSHSIHFPERSNDVVDWISGRKDWSAVPVAPVTLEDKCWIGFNVIILKGVTVGEGAVVGAGSVVTRDVAPYTVVAGNPARVIRVLDR